MPLIRQGPFRPQGIVGNQPIGCARLIAHDPLRPERPLPYERHCSSAINKALFDPDEFLPGQIVEFSRIAVLEEFRRKVPKPNAGAISPQISQRQGAGANRFPVIPVSLFLALMSMMVLADADYGFAMMEPKLQRLLRRFGLIFEPVGEPIDYHGWRSPYVIQQHNALRGLNPSLDNLYSQINQSMQAGLADQRWAHRTLTPA